MRGFALAATPSRLVAVTFPGGVVEVAAAAVEPTAVCFSGTGSTEDAEAEYDTEQRPENPAVSFRA